MVILHLKGQQSNMIPIRYNRMGNDLHHNTQWIINHGAGLLDISITGASGLLWMFPDGTTSTSTRPLKTVLEGTTVVRCNNFSINGLGVIIRATDTAIQTSSLKLINLPNIRYTFQCLKPNILVGDISLFPRITYLFSIASTQNYITGDISRFPRINNWVELANLNYLVGDISTIYPNTAAKVIRNCALLTGSMGIVSTNNPIQFYANASVSPAEYDQTIANCVSAGGMNKTLIISSRRTSASDADKATLISRGWTVNDSNV